MMARACSNSPEEGNSIAPDGLGPDSREYLDPGIKGPAASVSPSIAGLQYLEEFTGESHRPPGRGLPAAELA